MEDKRSSSIDGRNELADRLTEALNNPDARLMILGAMADFEIYKKETALIPYDGGQTEYLIQRFLVAKKVKGCTDNTCKRYGDNLRRCFAEIGKGPLQIDHTDVQAQLARLIIRGCGKDYQQHIMRTFSSFYGWLTKEELIDKNIMLKIDPIKNKPKHKKAFSDMDVEKIRTACRTKRESALVEVLISTGCRIFEVAKLKRSEVENEAIDIIGKGEKQRTVYLNAKAQLAIAGYLNQRKDNNPWLFPSSIRVGKPVTSGENISLPGGAEWYTMPENVSENSHNDNSTLEAIIRAIGRRAGIEKCHPHRFRRTCATMALRRGMSLVHVQQMLGHDSLETTRRYLDITEEELAQAHRKYVV